MRVRLTVKKKAPAVVNGMPNQSYFFDTVINTDNPYFKPTLEEAFKASGRRDADVVVIEPWD